METLTYRQHGDYLLPEITLSEHPKETLGKYGMLRRTHLSRNKKGLFNHLILTEQLFPHLLEIDRTAERRLEQMMAELTENDPPPDKGTDQMGWVAHMNSLKAQAEEVIMSELIYN